MRRIKSWTVRSTSLKREGRKGREGILYGPAIGQGQRCRCGASIAVDCRIYCPAEVFMDKRASACIGGFVFFFGRLAGAPLLAFLALQGAPPTHPPQPIR